MPELTFLQAILDVLDPHIALLDQLGTVVATNNAWDRFAADNGGAPRRCGVGVDYLDICREDPHDAIAHDVAVGLAAVLSGERPSFSIEYPCHAPTHERWFLLDVRALPALDGGVLVMHTNVTTAYSTQRALVGQAHRFRSLLQHAGDLISVMSSDGVITYQSPALERMMGYAAGELDGQDGLALLHPDDHAQAQARLGAIAQKADASTRVEVRMRRRDGSWRWLDTVATNLLHDPDVRGFVMNSRDITEAKATLARLAERERTLGLALEAGRMAVWDWDVATDRMTWSGVEHLDTSTEWSGWHPGAFSADSRVAATAVHPDDREAARLVAEKAEAEGWDAYEVDYRVLTADGGTRWLNDRGIGVEHDGNGRARRMVGITRDITESRTIQRALAERAESFSTLFEATAEAMAIHDGKVFIAVNEAYATLIGMTEENLIGRSIVELVAPQSTEVARDHAARGFEEPYEILARHRDGSEFPVELLGRPIRYEGRTLRLLTVRDIRARREAEAVLRASEARFRALVQDATDIVVVFTADGGLRYANPALERVLGHPLDAYVNGLRLDLVHPDDRAALMQAWTWIAESPGNRRRLVYRTRSAAGAWVWLDAVVTNLLNEPAVGGIVLNARDVTEQKRLEAELRHLGLHDPLTGLANRALFSDRLDAALMSTDEDGGRAGVLFIDLDHFKHVNDAFGHAAGDALLREVARRLSAALPLSETIARVGGDEFVVLLPTVADEREAEGIAGRLLAAMDAPLVWQGQEIHVGLSIGIALEDPGQSAADMLMRAGDAALYRAKLAGRGRTMVHRPEMTAHASRRMTLATDVREAASRGEFTLVYQPIADLTTGQVVHLEALLRWRHPRYGQVPPTEFIPLAEEIGSIVAIGRWVIEEACRQIARWGHASPVVAINLSAAQFLDPDLVRDLTTGQACGGVHPQRLRVEITEHSLLLDLPLATATLEKLRAVGMTTAIDDFGTGYSSLSYLRTLPVDTVKLDRSWVHQLSSDPKALAFIAGVTALAHSVGLTVTAEGIETAEQLALLQQAGCDHGQGYYLARPAPAGEIPSGTVFVPHLDGSHLGDA